MIIVGLVIFLFAIAVLSLSFWVPGLLERLPIDAGPLYWMYLLFKPAIDVFAMLIGLGASVMLWSIGSIQAIPDVMDGSFKAIGGLFSLFVSPFSIAFKTISDSFSAAVGSIGYAIGSIFDIGKILDDIFKSIL